MGLLVRELNALWQSALVLACAAQLYHGEMGARLRKASMAHGAAMAGEPAMPEPELTAVAAGDSAAQSVVPGDGAAQTAAGVTVCTPCTLTMRARGGNSFAFSEEFAQADLSLVQAYASFASAVGAADLGEAWTIKPFYGGKDVIKLLSLAVRPTCTSAVRVVLCDTFVSCAAWPNSQDVHGCTIGMAIGKPRWHKAGTQFRACFLALHGIGLIPLTPFPPYLARRNALPICNLFSKKSLMGLK
jgi:hypothetical protein